jgi:hypothetical protein
MRYLTSKEMAQLFMNEDVVAIGRGPGGLTITTRSGTPVPLPPGVTAQFTQDKNIPTDEDDLFSL